jgi:hypothetical protein
MVIPVPERQGLRRRETALVQFPLPSPLRPQIPQRTVAFGQSLISVVTCRTSAGWEGPSIGTRNPSRSSATGTPTFRTAMGGCVRIGRGLARVWEVTSGAGMQYMRTAGSRSHVRVSWPTAARLCPGGLLPMRRTWCPTIRRTTHPLSSPFPATSDHTPRGRALETTEARPGQGDLRQRDG